MKLKYVIIYILFLTIQACGSFPQQTASHIHDGGNHFGFSEVESENSFGSESDQTSGLSFSKAEETLVFDQNYATGIGIILIPLSIQDGFTIPDRTLRFCRSFFKSSCEHLRQQAGQQNRFPRAPVSLPDGTDN